MPPRAVPALVLVLVAALSLPVSLSAQTSYRATVLDSSRAPIAGASVTADPPATGVAVTEAPAIGARVESSTVARYDVWALIEVGTESAATRIPSTRASSGRRDINGSKLKVRLSLTFKD